MMPSNCFQPFAVREQEEKELERLKDLDIIEEGATPYVSSIVAFPKPINPKCIRLCAH